MRLFDYDKASRLMEAAGIDIILAHTDVNAGYLADYNCHFIFNASFVLDDASMTYMTFAGLPRDESKGAFLVPWVGEDGDIEAVQPWIQDRRFYGRGALGPTKPGQTLLAGEHPVACAAQALRDRGLAESCIGLEWRYLPIETYELLKEALPKATFRDALPILWRLRMIKHPSEIERLREAARATENAIKDAFDEAQPGMSELDFERVLRGSLAAQGAGWAWNHIAFGPKGAKVIRPTDNRVEPGQVLRVDAGGTYGGYVCDMSRVAVLGEPDHSVLRVYEAAHQAYDAIRAAAGPGVRACELHRIANGAMASAGLDPFYFSFGHGIGRDVHEPPNLIAADETPLEPGMVVDLEIPLRVAGIGSINIEEEVLITKDGVEPLNLMSRDLYRIPIG